MSLCLQYFWRSSLHRITQLTFNFSSLSSRSVWSHLSIRADDQLRQRVAFALNQIFAVVKPYFGPSEVFVNYHDIFVRNAFTSWKDILREISFSPLMAVNLSYLGSKSMAYVKETLGQISFADENFAREVSDASIYYISSFSLYHSLSLPISHSTNLFVHFDTVKSINSNRSCNFSLLVLYYSTKMAHIREIRMVTRLMLIPHWT